MLLHEALNAGTSSSAHRSRQNSPICPALAAEARSRLPTRGGAVLRSEDFVLGRNLTALEVPWERQETGTWALQQFDQKRHRAGDRVSGSAAQHGAC